MWIKPVTVSRAMMPGYVRLEAKFGQQSTGAESLWFDVPETLQKEISDQGNFWLQAVLPLAFQLQEPLECSVPADAVWLQNARQTMQIWNRWYPDLKPVEIKAAAISSPAPARENRTGLFFTGGVDSFHSLFDFEEPGASAGVVKKAVVDDLIYVCGYDIPLRDRAALDRKARTLANIARELGKNLVIITTNLRETRLRKLDWGKIMHGPALGAAGLILEGHCSRILFSASSNHQDDATPWGTHPLTDELLSSERLRFIRYGGAIARVEKTAVVAKSPVALNHLHVCWAEKSDTNCGVCEKCVRTMLTLEIFGALKQATCFPSGSVLDKLPGIRVTNPLAVPLWEELKAPALAHGRADIVRAIEACLANSRPGLMKRGFGILRGFEQRFRAARKARFRRA
ncbi:MAG: hypothetical protein H7Y43_16465 [Akkermansiaceae bacterium]|nr:hypothetical protein [Verrucomicrobiales bacterium]